jgi:hypothetical protein
MADYRRAICILLILPALLGAAGCCGPWTEPPFETAYSAVSAQVKCGWRPGSDAGRRSNSARRNKDSPPSCSFSGSRH